MQNVNPNQEPFQQRYNRIYSRFLNEFPAALRNLTNDWNNLVNTQQNEERALIDYHSQMFAQLNQAQNSPQQLQQISQQMQNELQELQKLHQSQREAFQTFQQQIQEQLAEKRKPLEEQQKQELDELLKKQEKELEDFLNTNPPPTEEEIAEFKRKQQMQIQQLQTQHQNQLSQLEAQVRQSVTQQWQQQTQSQTSPSMPTPSQGSRYWGIESVTRDTPSSQPEQPSNQEQSQQPYQPQQSPTTTQQPSNNPVVTTVAIPQISGSVTNMFDPQQNITENGFTPSDKNYTFSTMDGKGMDSDKQTKIKSDIDAIEKANFEKYISKHDKYQMRDGHIAYKNGEKITEKDLNSLREEYMEKGRTKESLSTTADEYAKQNNLKYRFYFQDPRPVPKSDVEIVVNTEMSPTPKSSTPTFGSGKH